MTAVQMSRCDTCTKRWDWTPKGIGGYTAGTILDLAGRLLNFNLCGDALLAPSLFRRSRCGPPGASGCTLIAILTERSHLIEYGMVAVFIYEALTERASRGRRVPAPALLTILATSLVGVFDECIQVFLPSRVFDAQDILFNVLAAVMAVGTSVALDWARRRVDRNHLD